MSRALLLTFCLLTAVDADCGYTFLRNTTSQYVAAQSKGLYTSITALSQNTVYTEQFKPVPLNSSILTHPLNLAHNRSFHDPDRCTTFTELIVTDPSHPFVIDTRMELDGSKITKIETLVTDAGDWLFKRDSLPLLQLARGLGPHPRSRA
jgi:hypothetical protein